MGSKKPGETDVTEQAVEQRAVPRFGEVAAEALRYWEPRRVLYNLALAAVVAAHLIASWPAARTILSWDHLFLLIFLAVLANVCYCAAYAVDLFVQYSALRAAWTRWRWVVLWVGIVFGAVVAHFFASGMFAGSAG
jgi:hypothetical protein